MFNHRLLRLIMPSAGMSNQIVLVVFLGVVSLILASCEKKAIGTIPRAVITKDTVGAVDSTLLLCDRLDRLSSEVDSIARDARIAALSNDSCYQALLDSLDRYYFATVDVRYLVCLDSLAMHSDGDRSEAIAVHLVTLFERRGTNMLSYVCGNDRSAGRGLQELLARALSDEIAYPDASLIRLSAIRSAFREARMLCRQDQSKRRCVDSMFRTVMSGSDRGG